MSQVIYESETIDNLADAVRTVTGSEEELTVDEMTTLLANGDFGGGGYSDGLKFTLQTSGTYKNTYFVTGIGTCTDSVLRIPPVYKKVLVTGIGDRAFKNNTKIHTVIMPDTIRYIGEESFYQGSGTKNLSTVIFSKCLKYIGPRAFCSQRKLTDIILPEGLEEIEGYAFLGTGMQSIIIPKSVTTIGSSILGYHEEWETDYEQYRVYFKGNYGNYEGSYNYLNDQASYNCYWDCDKDCYYLLDSWDRSYLDLTSPGSYNITGFATILIMEPEDAEEEDGIILYENDAEMGDEKNLRLDIEEDYTVYYDPGYDSVDKYRKFTITLSEITDTDITVLSTRKVDGQKKIRIIDTSNVCAFHYFTYVIRRNLK